MMAPVWRGRGSGRQDDKSAKELISNAHKTKVLAAARSFVSLLAQLPN
jgi:hypothetical protein